MSRWIIAIAFSMVALSSTADTLSIAYNQDWQPYSSGEGNKVDGILVKLMNALLAEHMHLKISHYGLPWNRVQSSVKQGQFDVFITVPTPARLEYSGSSSNTVYTIEMRPVVLRNSETSHRIPNLNQLTQLRDFRVCDIIGNGWAKNFYESLQVEFTKVPTVDNCLMMISHARADLLVQPVEVTSMHAKALGLTDSLEILPLTYGKMEFTLLLSKESHVYPAFINQFDTMISELKTSGEYDRLIEQIKMQHY
ncbi:MAG: transporter substrate-binding domain-containing protein [Hahellaceae bacterium]|nr:transporter substrate-binding domain-containing protein [Hahellaceae bacterium]